MQYRRRPAHTAPSKTPRELMTMIVTKMGSKVYNHELSFSEVCVTGGSDDGDAVFHSGMCKPLPSGSLPMESRPSPTCTVPEFSGENAENGSAHSFRGELALMWMLSIQMCPLVL